MSTTRFTLAADAWTDLGATPCMIQSTGPRPVLFVVNATVPGTLDAAAHTLPQGIHQVPFASSKVWARAGTAGGATVLASR